MAGACEMVLLRVAGSVGELRYEGPVRVIMAETPIEGCVTVILTESAGTTVRWQPPEPELPPDLLPKVEKVVSRMVRSAVRLARQQGLDAPRRVRRWRVL